MNQLTQTRKWPSLTLSRWQIIQLSMLSALLAGMVFWKVQYDQILPKMNPVHMFLKDPGTVNDQSIAKTTVPSSSVVKPRL